MRFECQRIRWLALKLIAILFAVIRFVESVLCSEPKPEISLNLSLAMSPQIES